MEIAFYLFMIVVCVVFIITIILAMSNIAEAKASRRGALEKTLNSVENFNPSQKFISEDAIGAIGLDEGHQTICLITHNPDILVRILAYKDILSSEIIQDGLVTTRSSYGGVALGGLGVVGGSQISTTQIRRIDLRLTLNDTQQPVFMINIMNVPPNGATLDQPFGASRSVADAQNIALHWHALIGVIMHRA